MMERLPGFRDFYPEPLPHSDVWSADARRYIFDGWRAVARRYAFREYDGPPLEPLELYTLKSGQEIVGQLYNFVDKGDRAIALRPEMTPTLARMAAAHERHYKKPMKWFAIPQLFRYERAQKGRLREHFQFNCDLIGDPGPAADAEILALLIDTLRVFGLTAEDFVVRLSSRNAWQDFFRQRSSVAEDEYEFYQAIDKLEREDEAESRKKLAQLKISFDEVKQFIQAGRPTAQLEEVVKNLEARGLGEFVRIDYHVIRGLAYYSGVVFEAFDRKGEFRAIAGGGRYDQLLHLISGGKVDLPALGFGMGDVVLLELLKARGLLPKFEPTIDLWCLIEDEALRAPSLDLVQHLREAGYSVDYALAPAKSDKQFKRAVELGARYTLKLERAEDGDLSIKLKNLLTREEKSIVFKES